MSPAPRAYPPSSFPFFHLDPFPYSTLPSQLDQLTTQEIALSHLLLDSLDQGTWRKLLRIWRARREKERGSSNNDSTPSFALLDMSWPIPEDLGFLDSAQLAALPLHPDYKPTMDERAREIFRQRRNPTSIPPTSNDLAPTTETVPQDEESTAQAAAADIDSKILLDPTSEAPSADAVIDSTVSHDDSDSPLPSTVPSSPAPPSPEPESIHVLPSSNAALRRWMTISKPTEKSSRSLAADSFDWEPEPPKPLPVQPLLVHTSRRSISPFYEESPSPAPNEEETARHTTSFFDRLQFGSLDGNPATPFDQLPQDLPLHPEEIDVKADLSLEDRLAKPDPPAREPPIAAGDSLLQRISGARPPSPTPSAVSTSSCPPPLARKQARPKGVVPRSLTRRWHTFLVHSIINKLPDAEIRDLIIRSNLPEPVAIQIKRNPPSKRFCLVFVAYSTREERDIASAGLEGMSYGFQKLKLIIKQVEKPPEAYDWDWSSTSERFQEEFYRDQQRGPPPPVRDRSPKRRRISSSNSLRRSLSPLPPSDSFRPRSPSPLRRHSPPRRDSLDRFPRRERSRSPPLRNSGPPPLSRGRSRSPIRHRASSPPPPRPVTALDRPVPLSIIKDLHSMILNNLPNSITRQDVIDFFPPRSFVGLAINHPDDRRYVQVGAQRPIAHGSAFLLFETKAEREKFAQSFCSRKNFKGSPVPLWYDHKMKRIEEWLWWEMMEDWAVRNGGPRPVSPPPRQVRLRSRSPPPPRMRNASARDFSPPPLPRSRRDSSLRPNDPPQDRYPRSRNYSIDEPRPPRDFSYPPPPPNDSYYPPADISTRPSDPPYRESDSRYSAPSNPPFPPPLPSASEPYHPVHARYHTSPQDHYRPPPPPSQQQEQRKRATWSEEPAIPFSPAIPPPPSHFQPSQQHFPAPYYNSTIPPEPYQPNYQSNYIIPPPLAPPPADHSDPQALRSSAATRYGYSQETEYRRG